MSVEPEVLRIVDLPRWDGVPATVGDVPGEVVERLQIQVVPNLDPRCLSELLPNWIAVGDPVDNSAGKRVATWVVWRNGAGCVKRP